MGTCGVVDGDSLTPSVIIRTNAVSHEDERIKRHDVTPMSSTAAFSLLLGEKITLDWLATIRFRLVRVLSGRVRGAACEQ